MKVVHISHQDHGGAGGAAFRLHAGLRALGVDSRFLTTAAVHRAEHVLLAGDAVLADSLGQSVVRRVPEFQHAVDRWRKLVQGYPNRPRGLEMFSTPESALPGLRHFIPDDTDILHFHWICGLVPLDEPHPWLREFPIVWTLHDMNPFTGGCHFSFGCDHHTSACGNCFQLGSGENLDASRRILDQKRRSYAGLDITCVSPSRWMFQQATASSLLGARHHAHIANGIDISAFSIHEGARERFPMFGAEDTVLLFGSDSGTRRKGLEYLLHALRELAAQDAGRLRLAVFGPEPDQALLDVGLPVTALGYSTGSETLATQYSMADALVAPSIEDNLPNVVLEAQLCGLPVVAFRVGGLPDIVDHGSTGYLARPKDVDDLIQGIRWVVSRRAHRAELAATCRAEAVNRFDISRRAEDMIRLYQQILTRRHFPAQHDRSDTC